MLRQSPFKHHRFTRETILCVGRWYTRYPLSYQDVIDLLALPGIMIDRVSLDPLNQHNLGQSEFRNLGGWTEQEIPLQDQNKFSRACAEWADGELVIAHICYQSDFL